MAESASTERDPARRRFLVTGARGLLGTPLCDRLRAAGHDVVATDLPELDVTAADAVDAAFDEHRPAAVVHLAAWTAVDDCELDAERADRVNGAAVGIVVDAANRIGADVAYVSTDYVFGGRKRSPYLEDDATGPISAYGRSKLLGESHVGRVTGRAWIVRCQSIYGRGKKSFADAILARARAGLPLSVVTDQTVSPSYADDLATAVAAVALRAEPGLYHAANAGHCTWFEFARAILDEVGLSDLAIAETTAEALGRPAPRPSYSAFDCSRLEQATGIEMRQWRDALREYLARSGHTKSSTHTERSAQTQRRAPEEAGR